MPRLRPDQMAPEERRARVAHLRERFALGALTREEQAELLELVRLAVGESERPASVERGPCR